jgi:hypothetical protein
MKLDTIVSVLNFSAFRPEPDDPSANWKQRFPAHRSVLLNIGRASVWWQAIQKNGTFGEKGSLRGDLKEILGEAAVLLKDLADDGWCSLSLSTRYVMSLETNLVRRAGSEEMIKTTPRAVLGARYERGKRYAVTHNPETNVSLLLSCEEENLTKLESIMKEGGLRLGRLCCGAYVLLRHALSVTNNPRPAGSPGDFVYVVCSMGAVCALIQTQDRWVELRSRTDVYDETIDPVIELLRPFQQRIAPGSEIVIAADQVYPDLVAKIGELFPGHSINDLSAPNLLWTLLIQN